MAIGCNGMNWDKASLMPILVMGAQGKTLIGRTISGKQLGVNSCYEIIVDCLTDEPIDTSFYDIVFIQVDYGQSVFYVEGELISVCQRTTEQHRFATVLTFGCSLYRLFYSRNHRIIAQQCCQAIISELLASHGINATFVIKHQRMIAYMEQGGVSDYDFLQRLCIEQGLFFYYRHHALTGSVLHITDDNFHDCQHTLLFQPPNGLINKQPFVTSVMHHQLCLPERIRLRIKSVKGNSSMWEINTNNTTSIPGQGTVHLSQLYRCSDFSDVERYASCLQQQLDWQRQWWYMSVQAYVLQPGDQVVLKNYPLLEQQALRVLAISFHYDTTDSEQAHPFCLQAYFSVANQPYRMPIGLLQMPWKRSLHGIDPPQGWQEKVRYPCSGLFIATIVSSVDENGCYRIKPLFSDNTSPHDDIARQLQIGAGSKRHDPQGMHFPLAVGTRVVVGPLYEQMGNVILGVYTDDEQPSVVDSRYANQLVLRHPADMALVFEETNHHQRALLETQANQHGFFLEKQQQDDSVYLKSQGMINLSSQKSLTSRAGKRVCIRMEKGDFVAHSEYSVASKATIRWQAGRTIQCHIGQSGYISVEEGKLMLHSEQWWSDSNDILLRGKSLEMKSQFGYVMANKVLIDAMHAASVQVGTTAVDWLASGLSLKSPQIVLMASSLIKA